MDYRTVSKQYGNPRMWKPNTLVFGFIFVSNGLFSRSFENDEDLCPEVSVSLIDVFASMDVAMARFKINIYTGENFLYIIAN